MLVKRDLLFNKKILSPSIMHSADRFSEDLGSDNDNERIVWTYCMNVRMLGNIWIISKETRNSLSGQQILFLSSIKSNKCDLFFITFGRFDVKGAQMLSVNLDKFSIAI